MTVTFNTAPTAASNTPLTFTDVPTLRRTSDAGSNPLPTVYNNGFVVFECPELVAWLTTMYGGPGGGVHAKPQAASIVGPDVVIDYRQSIVSCNGKTFVFPPLSVVAQELVVAGGAENVVKKRLAATT